MRLPLALLVFAACGSPDTFHARVATDNGVHRDTQLAADDEEQPAYTKADLEKALIAERGKELAGERAIGEMQDGGAEESTSDVLHAMITDLAVRRRFIAALETCQATGHRCPPRLDEPAWTWDWEAGTPPPLDTPLRFDRDTWGKLAAELHGRACACRTIACVDGLGVAIDQLEVRPMRDLQGEEGSSLAITRARECLFRLRGKTAVADRTPTRAE